MGEGSLEAPVRHAIPWRDEEFYDADALEAELRRTFDICHGCRRCFNLCDSFPRLFDLIDESETMELDSVKAEDFGPVIDACTLCDMCFMTKCPYVPPHEFNLDFPHLMLRARAVEKRTGKVPWTVRQIAETDRNGKLAGVVAPLANWANKNGNAVTRPALEGVAGIDRRAELPKFHGKTFTARAHAEAPEINTDAPAHGRKAVLYATCFVNYNDPGIGTAAQAVLARNGVATEAVHPGCCGMPKLEHGDIERVAANAKRISAELVQWIDRGHDIVALVPSCALMLKFEWPLILPEDDAVKRLAEATWDLSEYVVDIARKEGLAPGLAPLDGGVAVHIACHARAQNVGNKAADMLKLLPETDIEVIERCSGHGGSWGMMKDNFDTAIKIGRPVARRAAEAAKSHVVSECPLAAIHIRQGMELLGGETPQSAPHPIELMARAYGIGT
jgi:glycerol-3-phosphate dehydrogenase subunit C